MASHAGVLLVASRFRPVLLRQLVRPTAGRGFHGDGCDTLSIYRSAEQRFYIMNAPGENEGGLGAANFFFTSVWGTVDGVESLTASSVSGGPIRR